MSALPSREIHEFGDHVYAILDVPRSWTNAKVIQHIETRGLGSPYDSAGRAKFFRVERRRFNWLRTHLSRLNPRGTKLELLRAVVSATPLGLIDLTDWSFTVPSSRHVVVEFNRAPLEAAGISLFKRQLGESVEAAVAYANWSGGIPPQARSTPNERVVNGIASVPSDEAFARVIRARKDVVRAMETAARNYEARTIFERGLGATENLGDALVDESGAQRTRITPEISHLTRFAFDAWRDSPASDGLFEALIAAHTGVELDRTHEAVRLAYRIWANAHGYPDIDPIELADIVQGSLRLAKRRVLNDAERIALLRRASDHMARLLHEKADAAQSGHVAAERSLLLALAELSKYPALTFEFETDR